MKTLFYTLVMLLSAVRLDAAAFKVNGELTWSIVEPRLTFKMNGGLQNISPAGTRSGTVKVVLWMTQARYPSPGYVVGQYTLGQLGGGYQFSDFTVNTPSKIPNLSGNYYFTIAIVEYTTAGWFNRLLINTGTRYLAVGDFPTQLKWPIPPAAVVAPPAVLGVGNRITLSLQASEYLNLFPVASQKTTQIVMDTKTAATVSSDSTTNKASYTYKVKSSTLKGKSYNAGIVSVKYSGSSSSATITLFYQNSTSGTYKSETKIYPPGNPSYTETNWGTFTSE